MSGKLFPSSKKKIDFVFKLYTHITNYETS